MKKVLFICGIVLIFSSCANKTYNTLVLGSAQFNGVFSPFFSSSGYDTDIVSFVTASLIINDRNGAPADGIAKYVTPEEKIIDGKTHTIYTFELFDAAKYSDGKSVTADDIIFTYKILCDPFYDGASTIFTTPILGINEYHYDDPDYKFALTKINEFMRSYTPTQAEINRIAEDLAKRYERPPSDFLPTGSYYEQYTLPEVYNKKEKSLETEYIQKNLSNQNLRVLDIAGIKKINNKTVQITIEGVDPKAIWNLGGIKIVPAYYYDPHFRKGDLSKVKAKNAHPFGAGPYQFIKYENNVVSLEKNPHYYLGEPNIQKIKIQVSSNANKLDAVKLGNIDISEITATPDMLNLIKEADLHYELIDNLGYGYIGINADRVNDVQVRRGLMCLMNRPPAVRTYFGELATVIERPMSKVSWAYPKDAKAIYPFSPENALEYFLLAGYQQVEGKLIKNGKQLRVEIGISGEGNMDHPTAPILTQMKEELAKLGGILEINDCDGNVLFDRLNNHQWDMWVAAWQSTLDPDMYQVYHSAGPSNHYRIKDRELDRLIIEARQSLDIAVRQHKYFRALDIIMEQAVEMPIYQRKNIYVFNPAMIDVSSLTKNMTPFYGFSAEIEKMRMLEK